MKLKKILSLLVILALCATLLAACSRTSTESFGGEEGDEPQIPTDTYETNSETEENEAPVETESESVSESEAESESESTSEESSETEAEVESGFAETVFYGGRIDGFDINQGKLTLTVCEVSGENVNQLTIADFKPVEKTRSLILPSNISVFSVESGKVSNSSLEAIATDMFAVLEGDYNYMELYLYRE